MQSRELMRGFAVLIVLAALTAGCASPGFVYQRLDTFLGWRLNDYVTLTQPQKAHYRLEFSELWRWHRRQQLPAYAANMRDAASALDRSVTPEDVGIFVERFRGYWKDLMSRTVPGLCPVMQSLSDAQTRQILDEVDDDTERYQRESVKRPIAERRRDHEKQMSKWLRRWSGPLNEEQRELVRQWAQQRRDTSTHWLDYRQAWRTRFELALRERDSSGRCEAFEPLLVTPSALRNEALTAAMDYNGKLWQQLIADVVAAAEPEQLAHAQRELREFAEHLDELTAERSS